eukprot:SAG31_NODE_966_length_10688_cov_8.343564_2_plen_89_part_00
MIIFAGNTHIDACGWSFLPMGCPNDGPLGGRYCTGPNREDPYVYDYLNCKLKADASACIRVTTCRMPGNRATQCAHVPGNTSRKPCVD